MKKVKIDEKRLSVKNGGSQNCTQIWTVRFGFTYDQPIAARFVRIYSMNRIIRKEVTKMLTSPPDICKGKVVFGQILPGMYDAKLVGVRNAPGRPGEAVKRFVFRITSGECKNRVCSYFVAINGRDQNFFLKLAIYFLGYSFKSVEDIDFEDLIGRRCRIKIRHTDRNGRIFPEIFGFEFADDQPWG